MGFTIRNLTAADADAVIAMNAEFVAYLAAMGDPDSTEQHFTKEKYLADGFGPQPAFAGYIAEDETGPLGYLLYCSGYNVDVAERLFFICDLWVGGNARRKGVGKGLMARCAADCRAWGGQRLEWNVFKPNALAFDFYRRLGGEVIDGLLVMSLQTDQI
ncbi:MAG: GNAT family N-acetyltransferase [Rhodospirillaceae bacterium]|jgi:ribosomal protein S18 acetylase RimI-like enzyme|nr:GNAT family N-acetyltransferase [Rhodospirillaceae bacterium]